MSHHVTRRSFLQTAGIGAASATAFSTLSANEGSASQKIKIIAISSSERLGKTTATALEASLESAVAFAPDRVETELIELANFEIPGYIAAGVPLKPGHRDDFPQVAEKLSAENVAGIIIGTPVYYSNMSSLCKAFLERCGQFRKTFAFSGKVAGVLAVGGNRNGGQELTLQTIHATLLCHEMLIVGEGRPTSHFGGTLWNNAKDDITQDEFGMQTARNLGRRVAEVALERKRAEPLKG